VQPEREVRSVHAGADPVASLQVLEVEIVRCVEDLPRVVEQGEIEEGRDLPAVLRVEKQVPGVPEAILAEAPERCGTADGLLEVERDLRAAVGRGVGRAESKREPPAPGSEREVELRLCDPAVELVRRAVPVIVALE